MSSPIKRRKGSFTSSPKKGRTDEVEVMVINPLLAKLGTKSPNSKPSSPLGRINRNSKSYNDKGAISLYAELISIPSKEKKVWNEEKLEQPDSPLPGVVHTKKGKKEKKVKRHKNKRKSKKKKLKRTIEEFQVGVDDKTLRKVRSYGNVREIMAIRRKPKNQSTKSDVGEKYIKALRRANSEPLLHSWECPRPDLSKKTKEVERELEKIEKKKKKVKKIKRLEKKDSNQDSLGVSTEEITLSTREFNDEDLIWEQKGIRPQIVSGSIDRLVYCLAEKVEPTFIYNFLLTHKYFIESITLLHKLRDMFYVKPNKNLSPSELDKFNQETLICQIRIVKVLKLWVENHYYFFENDEHLKKEFSIFIDSMDKNGVKDAVKWATLLRKTLEDKPNQDKESIVLEIDYQDEDLRPLLPSNIGLQNRFTFLDLHPLEVARQMTLADFKVFSAIGPLELYKCSWAKDKEKSKNVNLLTERFNIICFWVATEIISTIDPKQRIEVLSRFIQLAVFLMAMNNFHGVMEIYAALNMGCVQKLKTTWNAVPSKWIARLKEIEVLMESSGNYKNYREALACVQGPLIPFQAVNLGDLTFIEEVPTYLENGHVNFDKMTLIGKVVSEIERYQKSPYNFHHVPPIADYLLNQLHIISEKELYIKAKEVESDKKSSGETIRKKDFEKWEKARKQNKDKNELRVIERQEKKLLRNISWRFV